MIRIKQTKDSWHLKLGAKLVSFSLFLIGFVACGRAATPTLLPPIISTPTTQVNLPDGWETFTNDGQCAYTINFPSTIDVSTQGTYSWIFTPTNADPAGQIRNFIYVSVIPDGFDSSGGEIIYNYDPTETATLLEMQVGESRSLREDPNTAPWFTYTRLLDMALANQVAQTYENNQPWEFPPGTKEIRSYLQANGCTYLIGGYLATVGSGQLGAIDEELFHQIITTFRVSS